MILLKDNFNQITKLLEKIFKAGFTTERDILGISLDDLQKIPDITNIDITNIIKLKGAIRSKKLIAFLSGIDERKGEKNE